MHQFIYCSSLRASTEYKPLVSLLLKAQHVLHQEIQAQLSFGDSVIVLTLKVSVVIFVTCASSPLAKASHIPIPNCEGDTWPEESPKDCY